MASLTKRSTSKFWVACFTDRNGRRLKRSTSTTDRTKATKIALMYEEAAREKRTVLQVRRVLSDLHKSVSGNEVAEISVRSFFEAWLERKVPETAASTITFYRNESEKFLRFLGPQADGNLSEIGQDRILGFRNELAKSLAPKTVNHAIKFLRMVFRSARGDSLISDNPAEFVKTVRQQEDAAKRRPFSVPELRAVLDVADDEWKSMILFGLYTGQRLGDVSSLCHSNVDLMRGEIRFVTSKTRRQMILPIAPPLLRHLETMPSSDRPDAPLHPRAYAIVTAQGKSGHLSNQFGSLLAQAGLREKQPHRKTHGQGRGRGSAKTGLSFHSLRHTAVTLLKEAGVPAAVVMELVGHDSEQMSEHYTHVGDKALRVAARKLPDVLSPKK